MTIELVVILLVAALVVGGGGVYALTACQDKVGDAMIKNWMKDYEAGDWRVDDPFITTRE